MQKSIYNSPDEEIKSRELMLLARLSSNLSHEEEEEEISIMEYVKQLWNGRKIIIICLSVFTALGLFAAFSMKRTYTVSTVMVPQVSSTSNSSLSSLASLAGFDLGSANSGAELSPLIYPQIVSSVPFCRELMYTPLHFSEVDSAVSIYTYVTEIAKPTVKSSVMKYTIALPGTVLGAFRGENSGVELKDDEASDSPKPLVLSEDEVAILKMVGESVSLSVDKKEGYLTLCVVGPEPVVTAELALKAQELLQEAITRFRVEKSQSELDYIQARYNETKRETELYQEQLARINDRSQNLTGTFYNIERDRIQAKYALSNSIYSEMAKQLEQGKLQVKKDTPVFTIIQPVTVPMKPSNSRARTLIIWMFLGLVLGCGIVLGKGLLPKFKEVYANC